MSKTGLPGAALIATPLIATIAEGRQIPGTVVPILLIADGFAVAWYRQHARWDLLRSLFAPLGVGFALGAVYFVVAGDSDRFLTFGIGITVLVVVILQAIRFARSPVNTNRQVSPRTTAGFGTAGGFATFVANSAGPIFNSFLVSAGVDKTSFIGTSAWFYFGVNLIKVPLYLAIGTFSDGGAFFTGESLAFTAAVAPVVILGAFVGRRLFHRLPHRTFLWIVLVFAGLGALNLLRG